MSYDQTTYIAKAVDKNGYAAYSDEDNAVWHTLITRQTPIVKERACPEYIEGLRLLDLPKDRIPQCFEISDVLRDLTGWSLEPVPALISFDRFFELLANRRFPAATFVRTREELDYIKEPDIFHEIFGHCPLLTNPAYAAFTQTYGKLGLDANEEERILLARLYWYTIEFGLMNTPKGLRVYGGGILSSAQETVYALESNLPVRKPFDIMDALRTPYRIDEIQPTYFVLENFDQLFNLVNIDLMSYIRQAHILGEYVPKHPC